MIIENDNDSGHDPFAVALAEVLRGARLRRGFSIADMAHKTRLSPLVIDLIESGAFAAPYVDVDRIARCLGHSSGAPFLKAAWMLQDWTAEEAVAS